MKLILIFVSFGSTTSRDILGGQWTINPEATLQFLLPEGVPPRRQDLGSTQNSLRHRKEERSYQRHHRPSGAQSRTVRCPTTDGPMTYRGLSRTLQSRP